MPSSAYIKLVPASNQNSITLNEVKELFYYYKEITGKTGNQLGWEYDQAAFPYELTERNDAEGKWFYLKGTETNYHFIVLGTGIESLENDEGEMEEVSYIQVVLPEGSTHGDKGKANEFCKFLSKKLAGQLHLFNGRVMYFYKRK
jgi:hypothetical protein